MVIEESGSGSSESGQVPVDGEFLSQQPADAICSLGITRQVVTGYLVDHLRRHYAGETLIEAPSLRNLIWRLAPSTGILIDSIWHWRPELTEKRPGILVKPNSYQNYRPSLGDRRHGITADIQGNAHFETFWIGSHTVFCIGRTGAEAEVLGAETKRELTQHGPVILQCLGLEKYQVREEGAISEIEESTENFVVPITIAIGYKESWVLRALAPPLSGVTIEALLDC